MVWKYHELKYYNLTQFLDRRNPPKDVWQYCGTGTSRTTLCQEHWAKRTQCKACYSATWFLLSGLVDDLAVGGWSDTLEEEIIPFRERLAIAFQLLDVKSLSSYLRRMTEQACLCGDIDAIILMGLTFSGMDFLQSYVDRTGDVQSAAILSSSVCPQRFKDRRTERWLESYRDLLDVV